MRGGDARLTGLDIAGWIVDVIDLDLRILFTDVIDLDLDLDLRLVFIRARKGDVSDHSRGDTG
jgi:hypothetical protein